MNDDVEDINDTNYELPEHIVRVQELVPDEIAEQHNWIGRNRVIMNNYLRLIVLVLEKITSLMIKKNRRCVSKMK